MSSVDFRLRGASHISSYFKALGAVAQEEHGRLSFLEFNYNTIGVHVSMVSTWRDRQFRLGLALAMLVKLAQTCVGAVGFFMHPLYMCAATTKHLAAHEPSRPQERAPIAGYMCPPHGMHFYLVIVAAPVKIVSSRKVAQAVEKKNDPH